MFIVLKIKKQNTSSQNYPRELLMTTFVIDICLFLFFPQNLILWSTYEIVSKHKMFNSNTEFQFYISILEKCFDLESVIILSVQSIIKYRIKIFKSMHKGN